MVPPDFQSSSTNSKTSRHYVTPHKIALLVLIKEFCFVKHRCLHKQLNQKFEEITWEHTNPQNRDFASTMLKLIQNPDMDLKRLINIIHPVMHPQTYQKFIDKLHDVRKQNGVAAIMDYIATLDSLLVEPAPLLPVIQKSSVLGLFIRHMLLAFDKLSFSLVVKLCEKFHAYFDAAFGQQVLEESVISIADESIDDATDSPIDDKLDESHEEFQVFASQKQAEFFIAQQAALLQTNESAALSPFDLQQKIKELLKGNPELYEACYLSYLNSLRVKEYCGARDNLYHHFDRNTLLHTGAQDCKSVVPSEDLSRSSRYAALNLAMLHTLFDHKDEALAALNEAIMVAQEVNDNTCLQYALSWLYRLTSENKEDLIEKSITKSTELGIWYLTSLGIQALTKVKSFATTAPSSVFEFLSKSDVQNCQHSMTDIISPAYTLRAGMWSFYGHGMMCHLYSQIILFMNTADQVWGGVYHIGEGTCLALRNLAMTYASEGMHAEAGEVLSLAKELFPSHTEHSSIWQLGDLLIEFDAALFQGRWLKAQEICRGIAIFDKDEAHLKKAQLLLHEGNTSEADQILKQLLDERENELSPHFFVRALLLRAEVLFSTPNHVIALPLLMTALAKSRSHHLLYLETLTIIQVATEQLELGLSNQAMMLLEEIFITLHTHGTLYDKGSCCFLYARCMVSIALQKGNDDIDNLKKKMQSAVALSFSALNYFKKLHAVQKIKTILSWQAYVYNYLGMQSERNDVAHSFRNVDEMLYSG